MAQKDQNLCWPAQNNYWSKAFEIFCRTMFKHYCPLQVFGLENLCKKPFLICSNHSSHIDSALLMVGANLKFSQTGLIAAKDYFFDQSSKNYLHYLMNLVPIERKSGSKALHDSIAICKAFLGDKERALIIYPEGTRSSNGKISKFKEGAAIMAHELNIPMIPAYIDKAYLALPKGSYIMRPTNISVSFGKPVFVKDFLVSSDLEDRKLIFNAYKEATLELQNRVENLSKERLQDV